MPVVNGEPRAPDQRPADPVQLADLLSASGGDPVALADALRAARARVVGDADERDLCRTELRLLRRQAARGDASADLRVAVERAEAATLALERRALAATADGDPAALFELAEMRAWLRSREPEVATDLGAEIARRCAAVAVDDRLREEVRERYVALSTDEEDLDLEHRIALLQENTEVLQALARRSADPLLRQTARRLQRATWDRILARRVERALTPRGARILETTSLLLLLLLFALLGVEALVTVSERTAQWFLWIDAGVCALFVAEFAFKLSLAPAKLSWFLRSAITDLVPALPAALMFLDVPTIASPGEAVWVRALRLLRIAYFARYVRALRPALRLFRLLLFMVRGADFLVARFSWLLNRNFVFFEPSHGTAVSVLAPNNARGEAFAALRREYVLLADAGAALRVPALERRAADLAARLALAPPSVPPPRRAFDAARDIAVERAIDVLFALRAEDLNRWLPRADVLALDRVARVLAAPVVRALPFVRPLGSRHLADTPEQRVVDLAQRVARRLEVWRERTLFVADLQGILTGPQILDHVATAMVKASQRPAVRLLLFGGLFVLVRLLVGKASAVGHFLERFVATPLLVLGAVCLVLLSLGRWLKRLAGEASDSLDRTAEAHFLNLLEVLKCREEGGDLQFLARRVFRPELAPSEATWLLTAQLEAVRSGALGPLPRVPDGVADEAYRVALLYLHFLDGAILHQTDNKTSQQLLANLSIENLRAEYLHTTPRQRRRLRRLSLEEGGLSGPNLWFSCIVESIALEVARRVLDYNRYCLSLAQLVGASDRERAEMKAWLAKRSGEAAGRSVERVEVPRGRQVAATTEFSALDFLVPDAARVEYLRRMFGDDVVDVLQRDREGLIREVFGMRRLDLLPRSRRSINFFAVYRRRLSGGRILLVPLVWVWLAGRVFGLGIARTAQIVGEILAPDRARVRRRSGRAPFAVAARKIDRMKGPIAWEAMRMRAALDPYYCGVPCGWSEPAPAEPVCELECDMEFLGLGERRRHELRQIAEQLRRRVDDAHRRLPKLTAGMLPASAPAAAAAERALTIAFAADRRGVRSLAGAEAWLAAALPVYAARATKLRRKRLAVLGRWLWRGLRPHPIELWLAGPLAAQRLGRRARRNLKAAYESNRPVRAVVDAWRALPPGVTPTEGARAVLAKIAADERDVARDLAALRAVQSIAVLDVRNYRKLVFALGGYARDGATEVPIDVDGVVSATSVVR